MGGGSKDTGVVAVVASHVQHEDSIHDLTLHVAPAPTAAAHAHAQRGRRVLSPAAHY